jgi:hypothetical protein
MDLLQTYRNEVIKRGLIDGKICKYSDYIYFDDMDLF